MVDFEQILLHALHKMCVENLQRSLKIACSGGPEETLQGELAHYLRLKLGKSFLLVQEARLKRDKRPRRSAVDFVVYKEDHTVSCAIEMKHNNVNQKASDFISRFAEDTKKLDEIKKTGYENTRFLQVGVFLEIYCDDSKNGNISSDNYALNKNWLSGNSPSSFIKDVMDGLNIQVFPVDTNFSSEQLECGPIYAAAKPVAFFESKPGLKGRIHFLARRMG